MFCPKCGQQQISEDVRFCSACGVELDTRDHVLIRLMAMVMHIALTVLALSGWGPWSGPMYFQVRVLIVLVSVITFLLLFSKDLKRALSNLLRQEKDQPLQSSLPSSTTSSGFNQVGSASIQAALPPGWSVPVNGFGSRAKNTAEMLRRPPSVTERTTELLDKDPQDPS